MADDPDEIAAQTYREVAINAMARICRELRDGGVHEATIASWFVSVGLVLARSCEVPQATVVEQVARYYHAHDADPTN